MKISRANTVARRASCMGLAITVALSVTGCVTEKVGPKGSTSTSKSSAIPLPDSFASPAVKAQSVRSRVLVELKPGGSIPYDGLTLPVLSPDGKLAATQVGTPPTWPTMLADDAALPVESHLEVYDLSVTPPTRVAIETQAYEGCLLGRGSSAEGFLVERHNSDGSRWIGVVRWATGEVRWLTHDASVNAHGVLTAAGDVVFTQRDVGGVESALILQDASGRRSELRTPGVSYAFPMATSDPGVVYAFSQSSSGLEVLAIRVRESSTQAGMRALSSVLSRRKIPVGAGSLDAMTAYQSATTVAPVLPAVSTETSMASGNDSRVTITDPLVFFHAASQRLARFDPAAGSMVMMSPSSIAACRWDASTDGASADGYLVAVAGEASRASDSGGGGGGGVVFEPMRVAGSADAAGGASAASARVVASPMIPRRTTDAAKPVILLGPIRGEPDRLAITVLRGAPEPTDVKERQE